MINHASLHLVGCVIYAWSPRARGISWREPSHSSFHLGCTNDNPLMAPLAHLRMFGGHVDLLLRDRFVGYYGNWFGLPITWQLIGSDILVTVTIGY